MIARCGVDGRMVEWNGSYGQMVERNGVMVELCLPLHVVIAVVEEECLAAWSKSWPESGMWMYARGLLLLPIGTSH